MKIYTKTGDKGESSLFSGARVPKDHARVEAYGNVDELNSYLGVVRALHPPTEIDQVLQEIQNDLFVAGSDLATPHDQTRPEVPRMREEDATRLEAHIDRIDAQLPPLRSFIIPGGSLVGAHLQVARTICRRAERQVVKLSHAEDVGRAPLIYLNRLSDLLYMLARFANHLSGQPETTWKGLGSPEQTPKNSDRGSRQART